MLVQWYLDEKMARAWIGSVTIDIFGDSLKRGTATRTLRRFGYRCVKWEPTEWGAESRLERCAARRGGKP